MLTGEACKCLRSKSHFLGLFFYDISDLKTGPITDHFTCRLLPKFGKNNGLIYAEDSFTFSKTILKLHEK